MSDTFAIPQKDGALSRAAQGAARVVQGGRGPGLLYRGETSHAAASPM